MTVVLFTKIISVTKAISHTRSQLRVQDVTQPLTLIYWLIIHFQVGCYWSDLSDRFVRPSCMMIAPRLASCHLAGAMCAHPRKAAAWNLVMGPLSLSKSEETPLDKSTTGTSHCSIHGQDWPIPRNNISEGHRSLAVKSEWQLYKQGVWLIRLSSSWFGALGMWGTFTKILTWLFTSWVFLIVQMIKGKSKHNKCLCMICLHPRDFCYT